MRSVSRCQPLARRPGRLPLPALAHGCLLGAEREVCARRAGAGAVPPRRPTRPSPPGGQGERKMSRLRADLAHPGKQEVGEGQKGWEQQLHRCKASRQTLPQQTPQVLFLTLPYKSYLFGGKTEPNPTPKHFNWSPCQKCSGCSPCRQLNHRVPLTPQRPARFETGIFFCPLRWTGLGLIHIR